MSNDQNQRRRSNPGAAGEPVHYEAPGWLSTSDLEQELLLAVVADSRSLLPEDRFRRLDAYFAADLEETEHPVSTFPIAASRRLPAATR